MILNEVRAVVHRYDPTIEVRYERPFFAFIRDCKMIGMLGKSSASVDRIFDLWRDWYIKRDLAELDLCVLKLNGGA